MKYIYRELRLSDGLFITERITRYSCRHVHYKYKIEGKGPDRARRVTADSVVRRRFDQLVEVMSKDEV